MVVIVICVALLILVCFRALLLTYFEIRDFYRKGEDDD